MLAGLLGFFIGTVFGSVMICCLTLASEADDEMDKESKNKTDDNTADSE